MLQNWYPNGASGLQALKREEKKNPTKPFPQPSTADAPSHQPWDMETGGGTTHVQDLSEGSATATQSSLTGVRGFLSRFNPTRYLPGRRGHRQSLQNAPPIPLPRRADNGPTFMDVMSVPHPRDMGLLTLGRPKSPDSVSTTDEAEEVAAIQLPQLPELPGVTSRVNSLKRSRNRSDFDLLALKGKPKI